MSEPLTPTLGKSTSSSKKTRSRARSPRPTSPDSSAQEILAALESLRTRLEKLENQDAAESTLQPLREEIDKLKEQLATAKPLQPSAPDHEDAPIQEGRVTKRRGFFRAS
jgi:type VI protein secretion system component VasF